MDKPLPLWGRPLDQYVGSYQFEKIRQRGLFDQDPESSLTQEAADALSALSRVGDGGGPKGSDALSAPVSMKDFRAILKLVQYPKAYSSLVKPSAIRGCIKLMSGIKLGDKFSPFSYEYGYLCFRVLTIVLGICILRQSSQLDSSIQSMAAGARVDPQADVMQLLGLYTSVAIATEISRKNEDRLDRILDLRKTEEHPKPSSLTMIQDIGLLSVMLWDDRKAFFKALKSTYYPGISAVMFVLWRVSRWERNSTKANSQLTTLHDIFFRYDLIATSDQRPTRTEMGMHSDAGERLLAWEGNFRQVDLEDCREVIGAYIDQFKPRNLLYGHLGVLDGPIILRALVRFVTPGTEDLLPTILEVTVKRIWDEMKNPAEPHKPDIYVDAVRDTFTNYATILQNRVFGQMNHTLFQELTNTITKHDLIDLAARAMLMLELPSEPPAPELAGSADYLPRVRNFYQQLSVSMPNQYIYAISDHCFSEWLKFRSYLVWCSEIRRLVPGDREHMRKCLGIWNDIGRALGYQVQEQSGFKDLIYGDLHAQRLHAGHYARHITSTALEGLRTAGNFLDLAITRYIGACSAIRSSCVTGEAFIIFPRELLTGQLNSEKDFLISYESRLRDAEIVLASAQNHSMRASASALPPEILAHIFRFVLSESGCLGSNASGSLYSKYPDLLSHVCSTWRRAAINSCDLWTHIDLVTNSRLIPRTEMHLLRSGQLPLYVHILGSLNSPDGQDGNHHARIASFAARTKSIYFDQHDGFYEDLAMRAFLESCTPGVLTRITMASSLFHRNNKHRWLLTREQQAPGNPNRNPPLLLNISKERFEHIMLGLTVFQSGGTYPLWDSKAYRGLTDLRLGGESEIAESWLVTVLKSNAQLRSLEVSVEVTNALPTDSLVEPVPVVDLERLELGYKCRPGPLLRWIAPGPKALRLILRYGTDMPLTEEPLLEEQFQMFLLRSNTTKVLTAIHEHYFELATIFTSIKTIKELAIDCSQMKKISGQLSRSRLHLDALYLFGCTFTADELLEFINAQTIQDIAFWNCVFQEPQPLFGHPRRISDDEFLTRCPKARIFSWREPRPAHAW